MPSGRQHNGYAEHSEEAHQILGRVVEQGTHRELTERRGYYYRLVKNQLELGN